MDKQDEDNIYFTEDLKSHFVEALERGIEIKDRSYHNVTYPSCFIGSDLVSFLVNNGYAKDIEEAISFGNLLMSFNVFEHVTKDHGFKNEYLFYHLTTHMRSRGSMERKEDGSPWSWKDLPLMKHSRSFNPENLNYQPSMPKRESVHSEEIHPDYNPIDEHDQARLDHVHPLKWVNPTPMKNYNLVVIGAGAGGLISAAGAAGIGANVALIEQHLLGGDCLNVGCVPSKALIASANAYFNAIEASKYGITGTEQAKVNFSTVMKRMRKMRATIATMDSAARYTQDLGVDVFIGKGIFKDEQTLQVGNEPIRFRNAIIATGATAAIPDIPGLESVDYLTNSTIFNLTECPNRLGIIGAGAIGSEMAQCFNRLGSNVTLISQSSRILDREDPDASDYIEETFISEGITLALGTNLKKVEKNENNTIEIHLQTSKRITVDRLLIAVGRAPNVSQMGLESCGVEFDRCLGIKVNDYLRTNKKNIYAVGDCASLYKFTHMADAMARIAIRNSLFMGREKVSDLIIPWGTYTDPEIAHVGLRIRDLEERNIAYDTYQSTFMENDRSILYGETEGWVKVHCVSGKDQILGATILGKNASEIISELTIAMKHGIGLGGLAQVIRPYPTQSDAIRRLGDSYNRKRLTPTVKSIVKKYLSLRKQF